MSLQAPMHLDTRKAEDGHSQHSPLNGFLLVSNEPMLLMLDSKPELNFPGEELGHSVFPSRPSHGITMQSTTLWMLGFLACAVVSCFSGIHGTR